MRQILLFHVDFWPAAPNYCCCRKLPIDNVCFPVRYEHINGATTTTETEIQIYILFHFIGQQNWLLTFKLAWKSFLCMPAVPFEYS